ncbi:MAG TPA: HNH endonuclease domain-containing protein [Leptospiraceae bacterium]|nr:HNH endonuclease domain-containing protein [Leptospiraceae bacterium]HMY34438.1 HNH endonuclease domain-containing protein [Leptospiraceae bacterium]HNM92100.1 HNH endonuclease domain-containing protein [Leptospiraceae bacterium]
MAKIISAIKYSENIQNLVNSFNIDDSFDHNIWDSDNLADLRKEIRDYYRLEQNAICSYCRQTISIIYPSNSHIEHIAPKSLHPEYIFEPKNLCVVCSDCNQIKKNQETLKTIPDTIKKKYKTKYPDKSDDFYIVHPHLDDYDKHILIINGFYIDNDSSKGNFTIGACRLNRKLGITGWEPEVVEETEIIQEFNNFIEEKNVLKKGKILENIKRKLFF